MQGLRTGARWLVAAGRRPQLGRLQLLAVAAAGGEWWRVAVERRAGGLVMG